MSHCEMSTGGLSHVQYMWKAKAILCFFLFAIREQRHLGLEFYPFGHAQSWCVPSREIDPAFSSFKTHLLLVIATNSNLGRLSGKSTALQTGRGRWGREQILMYRVPALLSLHCIFTRSWLQDHIDPCYSQEEIGP